MNAPAPGPGTGDAGSLRIEATASGDGLWVRGEVDLGNSAVLRQALDLLPDTGRCHLYLADLHFIDVAGTRELVRFARRTPQRTLVLHSPPALLRRIISIAWPEFAPRIEG